MALFDEVLKDVWKQKQTDREETATVIGKRIAALETRKQNLIESVVDGRIDRAIYNSQMARVGTELKGVQERLSETLVTAQELDCLLEFAAWLLERVAGIWNSASAGNKRRIQGALFPMGLDVAKDGFGTVSRPLFFNQLEPIPVEESGLAS